MTMSPLPAPTGGAPVKKERSSLVPARIKPAVIVVGSFAVLLVIIQLVNSAMASSRLDARFGIVPRTWDGLIGVLTAPLLHLNWAHLLSNLLPLLIFGFLIMLGTARQFVAVTALVWLVSGLGVWLFGPGNSATIGASGLVFGWLAYLIARGVFTRSFGQILLGVALLVIWGSLFWTGIVKVAVADITGVVTISWQAHLFGAIGGVLAAFLVAKADGPAKPKKATPAIPQSF
jgi:membrane associated rhomboid family serine protease